MALRAPCHNDVGFTTVGGDSNDFHIVVFLSPLELPCYHRPPPPPLLRPPPQEPVDEPLLPLLAAFARVLRSVIVRMTTVLRATAMRRKSSTKGPKHSAWDGL